MGELCPVKLAFILQVGDSIYLGCDVIGFAAQA